MSFEPMAVRRPKTGGRVKGTPNKRRAMAREQIEEVFEKLGGTEAFARWVESNDETRKLFYVRIWPKLLSLQVPAAAESGQARAEREEPPVQFYRPTVEWPVADPAGSPGI